MAVHERVQIKIEAIFQIAEDYLITKANLEASREALNPQMRNLRPIELDALKKEFVKKLSKTGDKTQQMKLGELFCIYFSPPYQELPLGHPIRNYYEENIAFREALKQLDSLLEDESSSQDWVATYEILLPYCIHTTRVRTHFYPVLMTFCPESQVKMATELGLYFEEVVHNRVENPHMTLDYDFLLDQQFFIQQMTRYLDLEEKAIFSKSIKTMTDDEFADLKASDDIFGYAYIKNPPPFEIGKKTIFSQPIEQPFPVSHGAMLEGLMKSRGKKLTLYSKEGELLYPENRNNGHAPMLDLNICKVLEGHPDQSIRGTVKVGEEGFLVCYSLFSDEETGDVFILKTEEPENQSYLSLDQLSTYLETNQTPITVLDHRKMAELFSQYPHIQNPFYELDPSLRELKEDPMGMKLVEESTVDILAKALRIESHQLVEKLNELIENQCQ